MNDYKAKSDKLLAKVRELIEEEGLGSQVMDKDLIERYALEVLDKNKEVQSSLYKDFRYEGSGIVQKIKNLVLGKIGNVSRNVVEKPLIKQQKFNNNVYVLLEYLIEENKKLREEKKGDLK